MNVKYWVRPNSIYDLILYIIQVHEKEHKMCVCVFFGWGGGVSLEDVVHMVTSMSNELLEVVK